MRRTGKANKHISQSGPNILNKLSKSLGISPMAKLSIRKTSPSVKSIFVSVLMGGFIYIVPVRETLYTPYIYLRLLWSQRKLR